MSKTKPVEAVPVFNAEPELTKLIEEYGSALSGYAFVAFHRADDGSPKMTAHVQNISPSETALACESIREFIWGDD